MSYFQLLDKNITNYCADSVEWCPIDSFQLYLVCGTYQLNTADDNTSEGQACPDQKRIGQIHLYRVTECNMKLELCSTLNTSAVLDMKWSSRRIRDKCLLGVANSIGEIIIFELTKEDRCEVCELKYCTKYSLLEDGECLILSLDWSVGNNSPIKICASDSKGNVSLFDLNENVDLILICSWKAHDYESWITTFSYWDPNVIYTGGDDCTLKIYDIRNNDRIASTTNQEHTAGVTSLRCSHLQQYILASGSYDECIKSWDMRNMGKSLSSFDVGGGIWRMKWHPQSSNNIMLVAAMYNGFHAIHNSINEPMRTLCSFKEHTSIAYGADICHVSNDNLFDMLSELKIGEKTDDAFLAATCSFYDKKLCLSLVYL